MRSGRWAPMPYQPGEARTGPSTACRRCTDGCAKRWPSAGRRAWRCWSKPRACRLRPCVPRWTCSLEPAGSRRTVPGGGCRVAVLDQAVRGPHCELVETPADDLPPALASAVAEFARYLGAERDRSEHTVRAYVGDVTSLMTHLARRGMTDVSELDLSVLRSWLAAQRTQGRSRATLARRASAA